MTIYPGPRQLTLAQREGAPNCPAPVLYANGAMQPILRAFLRAAELPVQPAPAADMPDWTLSAVPDLLLPEGAPPARGYVIGLGEGGLALRAADRAGFFSGLQTLWQLFARGPVCLHGEIRDWPQVATRSFQIDLGRQPETPREIKRIIGQQARYHYNECQLYLENSIKLDAFGAAADPDGLTKDEFLDVQQYAADLGVDVVLSLNLLGHMEKILEHPAFARLGEWAHGFRHPYQQYKGDLCPALPEARDFIRRVIRESCELSRSNKLMAGLDECWTIGSHPESRKRLDDNGGAGPLFGDWINFLHREIGGRGKQMWMWEDMLLYHLGALDMISPEIGMNIWHYEHIQEYPRYSFQNWRFVDSVELFSRRGHPFMLCCPPDLDSVHSMLRFSAGYPLEGILIVQWSGQQSVQEIQHVPRALAAGLLWTGTHPELEPALQAVHDCDRAAAARYADIYRIRPAGAKGGGGLDCPRFRSWPGNAAARRQGVDLLRAYAALPLDSPTLEVEAAFAALAHVGVTCDWARENTALVMRRMLARGLDRSPVLDDVIRELEIVVRVARELEPNGELLHRRYAEGTRRRPMVKLFAGSAAAPRLLLERLKRFQARPDEENWPFARVSLHLDGLGIDPCVHDLTIATGNDGRHYQEKNLGLIPTPHNDEFTVSLALEEKPRFVRIELNGFGSAAFTRVRLETVRGTALPMRVVDSHGYVINPENLLDFDQKIALFNPPDVMRNWRGTTPLPANFVILEFEPGREAPAI